MNSPSASALKPDAMIRVPFRLLHIYETVVWVAPYTNRIKDIDLIICSIELPGMMKIGAITSDMSAIAGAMCLKVNDCIE